MFVHTSFSVTFSFDLTGTASLVYFLVCVCVVYFFIWLCYVSVFQSIIAVFGSVCCSSDSPSIEGSYYYFYLSLSIYISLSLYSCNPLLTSVELWWWCKGRGEEGRCGERHRERYKTRIMCWDERYGKNGAVGSKEARKGYCLWVRKLSWGNISMLYLFLFVSLSTALNMGVFFFKGSKYVD